jgi:hypothetical protein
MVIITQGNTCVEEVMDREGAPLGVLIALSEPTPGMKSEAAAMGYWKLPGGQASYPVMQISLFKTGSTASAQAAGHQRHPEGRSTVDPDAGETGETAGNRVVKE